MDLFAAVYWLTLGAGQEFSVTKILLHRKKMFHGNITIINRLSLVHRDGDVLIFHVETVFIKDIFISNLIKSFWKL